MPSTVVNEDPTLPLTDAWRCCLLALGQPTRHLLEQLAMDLPSPLAAHFYQVLMEDPRASRFLDHEQVRDRLHPAMQRWIGQILCARAEQVEELIRVQSVIGDVHARVGIPVDLVLRGMRALTLSLGAALFERAPSTDVARQALETLLTSIGIAQEGMTLAYSRSRDRSSRADAAYRLFSLIQNISAERERQRALLLDWENQLLYAATGPQGLAAVPSLARSEFGLWFLHKGIPSFGDSSETQHVSALIAEIDELLRPDADRRAEAVHSLLGLIRQRLAQVRDLQGMLFERIGQVDSGSDTLTQLLNRRFLPTVLRREIELSAGTGVPFAVLLIDLDHFKTINDRYGHETGDRALQQVAAQLSQHTRGSDYLFRYGGEEFVVVLVSVTAVQAQVIAENLRKHIASHPLSLPDGGQLALSASIGVALFDGHPDYERLMARADAAMYQAKRNGRDQVALTTD